MTKLLVLIDLPDIGSMSSLLRVLSPLSVTFLLTTTQAGRRTTDLPSFNPPSRRSSTLRVNLELRSPDVTPALVQEGGRYLSVTWDVDELEAMNKHPRKGNQTWIHEYSVGFAEMARQWHQPFRRN